MNLLQKFKGWKKITAALIALLAAILGDIFGIDPAMIDNIVEVVKYYLLGQGVADVGIYMANTKTSNNGKNQVEKIKA